MAYQPAPNKTEGNLKETQVSDNDAISLLNKILKELKKLNIHMALMTDEEPENTEID